MIQTHRIRAVDLKEMLRLAGAYGFYYTNPEWTAPPELRKHNGVLDFYWQRLDRIGGFTIEDAHNFAESLSRLDSRLDKEAGRVLAMARFENGAAYNFTFAFVESGYAKRLLDPLLLFVKCGPFRITTEAEWLELRRRI